MDETYCASEEEGGREGRERGGRVRERRVTGVRAATSRLVGTRKGALECMARRVQHRMC